MTDVTRILSALEQGDPHAAEQLLPLVYDELRKLAAQKLAQEKPGQTLQATALVHEVNQLDIDTRSDIYSLVVVLDELLTGGASQIVTTLFAPAQARRLPSGLKATPMPYSCRKVRSS